MPIIVPTPTATKGKKDARRHRDKQRDEIKKRLPDIISQESIITKRKGKVVKVPIKGLNNPHLRQGRRPEGGKGLGGGIGQGTGKKGDVIDRRPGEEKGKRAGDEPGVDYLESSIDLEELIEMMVEDLGLPNLEEKDIQDIEVVSGIKIDGLVKSGPWSLLHRQKSAKEGFKRFYSFLSYLENETGRSELECFSALKKSEGVVDDALALLEDPNFAADDNEVEPFPIFYPEDLRFVKVEEDIQYESRAVVLAMMDVSGSMDTEKKYLVRSMLFWIVEFLRKLYDRVEIRFITHHTSARLVDEDDFFHTGESGGTFCYSAFELANGLIDNEYPTASWNVYPFYFSDGDDFNIERTVEEVSKTLEKKIQMMAYGEVRTKPYEAQDTSRLLLAFEKAFKMSRDTVGDLSVYHGNKDMPVVAVEVHKKEDLWPAIKEILKKGRWSQ